MAREAFIAAARRAHVLVAVYNSRQPTELPNPRRVSPAMESKRFSHAIHVRFKEFGQARTVGDTHDALDCLMYCWPAERGPRHRDALDACLKVIDGHRSVVDAENAFVEAAREAGILEDRQPHR